MEKRNAIYRIIELLSFIILLATTISSVLGNNTSFSNINSVYDIKFYDSKGDIGQIEYGFLERTPCMCRSFTDYLVLKNKGRDVSLKVNVFDKTKVVYLKPLEEKIVPIKVYVPCNKEKMVYKVRLEYGDEMKIIERKLIPKKCQNLLLGINLDNITDENHIINDIKNNTVFIHDCGAIEIPVVIRNIASFTDSYVLKVRKPLLFRANMTLTFTPLNSSLLSDLSHSSSSTSKSFILYPYEEKKIILRITPQCGQEGDFPIVIEAKSLNNNLYATERIFLQIKRPDNYKVSFINYNETFSKNLCKNTWQNVVLRVDSYQSFNETYKVSLISSPSLLGKLSLDKELLNGRDNKEAIIYIKPINAENLSFGVKVYGMESNTEKTIWFNQKLYDCYGFSQVINFSNWQPISKAYLKIETENTGTKEEAVSIVIRNLFKTVKKESFSINPGEKREIYLKPNSTGLYTIFSYINGTSLKHFRIFFVKLFDDKDYLQPVILNKEVYTRNDFINTTINIMNKGYADAKYDILIFDENNTVQSSQIILKKGRVGNIPLFYRIGNKTLQKFVIAINASRYISNENNKSDYSYSYFDTIVVKRQDTSFFNLLVNWRDNIDIWIKTHKCNTLEILLGIVIILFILVALAVHRQVPIYSQINKEWFSGVVIIMIIIALLSGIYMFKHNKLTMPPKPKGMIDPLVYESYTHDTITINLSDYFKDPDNEFLIYDTYNKSLDVDISIEGEVVKISAEREGVYHAVFIARDPEGASAISEEYTFIFRDKENVLTYLIRNNCWLVCYLLFLVLLCILLVISADIFRDPLKER